MADLIAQLEQLQKWHEYENGIISVEPTYHHQKAVAVIGEAIKALSNAPSATVAQPMNELCYLYWSAYHAGHHDTVEASYTDVLPVDRFDYWQDRVQECLEGGDMPTLAAAPAPASPAQTELNAIHELAMSPQDTAPREGDTFTLALLRQLLARIPGQAEPECSPTLTECPRCKNNFLKCDGLFKSVPAEPVQEAHIGPNAGNLSKYPSLTFRPEGWEPAKAAPRVEPVQEAVAIYMGRRHTPEGTREFWGYLHKGVESVPEGANLYAAPVSAPRVEAATIRDAARYQFLRSVRGSKVMHANYYGDRLDDECDDAIESFRALDMKPDEKVKS